MQTRVLLLAAVACGVSNALHVDPSLSRQLQPRRAVGVGGSRGGIGLRTAGPASADALRLKGGAPQALTAYIFALFKAIVGSGILSLANAIARWTDNPALIAPVVALSIAFALMAGHCYALIGEVTLMTGATSYQDAWARSIGAGTSWMPGLTVISQTLVACVCYMIIIGDLGADLMRGLGIKGWIANRNNLLTATSTAILLPLCLLRNFTILSYFSMLGVAGVVYTSGFMLFRKLEGSYTPGGAFFKAIPKGSEPAFGTRFEGLKTLILMATLNTAFQAHYDAPKFFNLMEPRSMEQFNKLVFPAFLAAGVVSCITMASGFLTFGGNANGLILNSYAATDKLALFGRLGIGASILFGYPLCLNGFRTGLLAFMGNSNASQSTKDLIAVCVLLFSTGVAMVLRNLGFLAAFAGAVLGSCIIYIFPALMHISATQKAVEADLKLPAKQRKGLTYTKRYQLSRALVGLGAVLAFLGGSVSYLEAFTDVLKK